MPAHLLPLSILAPMGNLKSETQLTQQNPFLILTHKFGILKDLLKSSGLSRNSKTIKA